MLPEGNKINNIWRGGHITLTQFSCESSILVEWKFGELVLWWEENWREKNPRSKTRTNIKLNTHITPALNLAQATSVGGERSCHYAIPATRYIVQMKREEEREMRKEWNEGQGRGMVQRLHEREKENPKGRKLKRSYPDIALILAYFAEDEADSQDGGESASGEEPTTPPPPAGGTTPAPTPAGGPPPPGGATPPPNPIIAAVVSLS